MPSASCHEMNLDQEIVSDQMYLLPNITDAQNQPVGHSNDNVKLQSMSRSIL